MGKMREKNPDRNSLLYVPWRQPYCVVFSWPFFQKQKHKNKKYEMYYESQSHAHLWTIQGSWERNRCMIRLNLYVFSISGSIYGITLSTAPRGYQLCGFVPNLYLAALTLRIFKPSFPPWMGIHPSQTLIPVSDITLNGSHGGPVSSMEVFINCRQTKIGRRLTRGNPSARSSPSPLLCPKLRQYSWCPFVSALPRVGNLRRNSHF